MSPFEQRLQEALATMRAKMNQETFDALKVDPRTYYSGRQAGKTYATLRACDIFIAPKRQHFGPGWICMHCHFANDNEIIRCEACTRSK